MCKATTKTQRRAICPACFRSHAISGTVMVQHGYERPEGWHANVNSCAGVYVPHFGTPEGRDFADSSAKSIRDYATAMRAHAGDIHSRTVQVTNYKGVVIENPTERDIENAACRAVREAESADKSARRIEELVANWTPAEPVEVEVEVRQTLTHWRRPNWGKACAASRMGAMKGIATSDTSRVTCPKCLNRMPAEPALPKS